MHVFLALVRRGAFLQFFADKFNGGGDLLVGKFFAE